MAPLRDDIASGEVWPDQRVEITAGPMAGRFGTVDWSDDIVICVNLEPLHPWDGEIHQTFSHGYYVNV